jgi:hypothetical protein
LPVSVLRPFAGGLLRDRRDQPVADDDRDAGNRAGAGAVDQPAASQHLH